MNNLNKKWYQRKWVWVLGIILILIIGIKFNNFIKDLNLKEVPNVMGLNYEDATTVLKNNGFKVTAIETDAEGILSESPWNRSIKKGVVFSVNGDTYPQHFEKTKDKKVTIFYAENDYIYNESKSEEGPKTEQITDNLSSDGERPEKNGFDEYTNNSYEIEGYTFSIPEYWVESESSTDSYRFYSETGGKTAMLMISYRFDEEDEVSLDALYADNDNMISVLESRFDECKVTDYEQYENQFNIKGMLYTYQFSKDVDGKKYDGTGKLLSFPSAQNNQWFYVEITITDNTEYTYNNDYKLILDSIAPSTNTDNTSTTGIRPEFKEALDSYETFFDEYIAFMKKYTEAENPIGMLTDYSSYMNKYIDMMDKLDKLDDGDLNDAEILYYAEVSARINKKLLEVAIQP